MKFLFDYTTFNNYYHSSLKKGSFKELIFFNKKYNNGDYIWQISKDTTDIVHPYMRHMYMTYNNGYIFFNLPATYQNRHYANHFSIGIRDKNVYNATKILIDIHYTTQDYVTRTSNNEKTKCWLYDGIELDTEGLREQMCNMPKKKKMSDVFSDTYIDYLILILATPFVPKNVLADVIKRLNNPEF